MSIINSDTTGHSRPEERKVAKKLYIGIILLVVAAVIVFLIFGQRKDMTNSSQSQTQGATTDPVPVSEQPKD